MNGNLNRALRKVKFHFGKTWVGYLTPSEIFALIKAGAKPTNSCQLSLEYYQKCLKMGDSSPHWFYFYPHKLNLIKVDSHDKKT
jgi:hypothetical protein